MNWDQRYGGMCQFCGLGPSGHSCEEARQRMQEWGEKLAAAVAADGPPPMAEILFWICRAIGPRHAPMTCTVRKAALHMLSPGQKRETCSDCFADWSAWLRWYDDAQSARANYKPDQEKP